MNSQLEIIEAEVLKLSPADRTHLPERLIVSLNADSEVEAAWAQEADRRESALDAGEATAISGSEAIARLRARLVR